jgi:hypothetical protein
MTQLQPELTEQGRHEMADIENITDVTDSEPSSMTFMQRLTGGYFEPGKTFEDINRKPTWLAIFLISAALSMAAAYVTSIRVDMAGITRKYMESMPLNLSEEQLNQMEEQAAARQNSPTSRVFQIVQTPVSSIIVYLALTGIFMLIFLMMQAHFKYKKALAITIWGFSIPGIIQTILNIVVLFLKEPFTVDPIDGIFTSNLGFLIDGKAHAALRSLVSSFDIFAIWTIILLSIGFAAISDKKLTKGKATTGIVILWIIFVLGKAGFRAALSGLGGMGR